MLAEEKSVPSAGNVTPEQFEVTPECHEILLHIYFFEKTTIITRIRNISRTNKKIYRFKK